VRVFVNLAILLALLFLSACAKNEPAGRNEDTKRLGKDKPAAEVSAGPTDQPTSAQNLDGTWRLVEVEFGPNIAGEEALEGTTFVVKGGRYTISGVHINRDGTFEIEWATNPHTITISEAQAVEVGKQVKYGDRIKYHGIVRIEGDKLEIRFTPLDKARPTDFTLPNEWANKYSARRVKE
jgi:uncharacterized protein (TIGR03067 family)